MAFLFLQDSWSLKNSLSPCSRHPPRPNKASTTKTSLLPKVRRKISIRGIQCSSYTAATLIGEALYDDVSSKAIQLYQEATDYAASRGLILADTKFEFGLVTTADGSQQVILIDEALTPDSSRYWPAASYKPGGPQPSFDKQYLRDWLTSSGFKKGLESGPLGKEGQGWVMTDDVVEGTRKRYEEAYEMLTGQKA